MKNIFIKTIRILNQNFFAAISIATITVAVNLFTSLALLTPTNTNISSTHFLFIWCGIILATINFALSTIITNTFNKAPLKDSDEEIEKFLKDNLSLCTILLWILSIASFIIIITLLMRSTL